MSGIDATCTKSAKDVAAARIDPQDVAAAKRGIQDSRKYRLDSLAEHKLTEPEHKLLNVSFAIHLSNSERAELFEEVNALVDAGTLTKAQFIAAKQLRRATYANSLLDRICFGVYTSKEEYDKAVKLANAYAASGLLRKAEVRDAIETGNGCKQAKSEIL